MNTTPDELEWRTGPGRRTTVQQYLPSGCAVSEPLLDGILATMEWLTEERGARVRNLTFYPDDEAAIDLGRNRDEALRDTVTYSTWSELQGLSDEALEVYAQLVRDGTNPPKARALAVLLTRGE